MRDCDGGVAGGFVERRASKSIIVGCDGSGLTVAAFVVDVIGADVLEVIIGLVKSFVMELGRYKSSQAASATSA